MNRLWHPSELRLHYLMFGLGTSLACLMKSGLGDNFSPSRSLNERCWSSIWQRLCSSTRWECRFSDAKSPSLGMRSCSRALHKESWGSCLIQTGVVCAYICFSLDLLQRYRMFIFSVTECVCYPERGCVCVTIDQWATTAASLLSYSIFPLAF